MNHTRPRALKECRPRIGRHEPMKNERLTSMRPTDLLDIERDLNRDALSEALRTMYPIGPGLDTSTLDAVVRASAVRQLDRRSTQHLPRQLSRWAALAASIAVVMVLTSRAAQPRVVAAADVDRSGRVDVLDAFALARSIERGRTLQPVWDLNRDGTIDDRDVQAIAERAVRINRQHQTGQAS